MKLVAVLRLPLAVDLGGFVELLQRMQLPHRVTEERGEQVLWVIESAAADVHALYQQFPQGDPQHSLPASPPDTGEAPRRVRPSLAVQARQSPVTLLFLLLTLVVGGVTLLGDNLPSLGWLTFVEFRVQGQYLAFRSLADTLADGQWWRLFTPMLVHFGILHIAMNSLWYWELGRRIEQRQGAINLIGLTLLFSLVSNIAQYLVSGPSLFGGLSGVIYGLLGHCWIYQRLAPDALYALPRGVLGSMLIWLLVCLSGLVSLIGFGDIANGAHVGGLLSGCFTGLLGGLWSRRKLAV